MSIYGDTNSELLEKIQALGPSVRIIAIYGMDHKHWAWIERPAPQELKKSPSKGTK